MAIGETAALVASLNLDTRKFDTGIKKANSGLSKLGKGLAVGAAAGAVAVGGAIAYAAKQAIDFEDAFQGVVKTVDADELKKAGLTFGDLSDSIRKMSTEMPNSAAELAHIAESAGALGIHAQDIEAFTKQVAILASTTNVSAEDAATALGQLQNVIGLTGDEFDNFAAALVDLGNKGASTEADILEIARRAGGAAKLIGVAKDATLGWSAAVANLGLDQELAGTSLQRFFLQVQNLVSGKGLNEVARIAGQVTPAAFKKMSAAAKKSLGGDFKKAFDKDATGAMEAFLRGLAKLPKDARLKEVQQLFGKGTGLTRTILGLTDSIDNNLDPALKDSVQAWKDATAAQLEFDKRNKTVRSAISRLHNTVIDAAISIGEGFAPALGRAADKLAAFLKQDENRKQLQDIGKEIGSFIDSIDWEAVTNGGKTMVRVLKTAADAGLVLLGIIAKLPKEFLALGAVGFGVNKLTGGALTGAVGGLASALSKSLAASIPIFGRAFVQPVFVTNMGAGLGGGLPGGLPGAAAEAGGAAAGLSIGAVVLGVGAAAALGGAAGGAIATAVTSVIDPTGLASAQRGESLGNRDPRRFDQFGRIIANNTTELIANTQDLRDVATSHDIAALIAVTKAETVLRAAAQRDAETSRALSPDVFKGIDAKLVAVADGILKAGAQRDAETSKSISDLIVTADSGLTTLDGSVVREGGNMSAAARNAGIAASMSNYGAAGMITSAIAANRPIINVDVAISATKINEVTVVEDRGGSRSGSRDGDGGGGPGQ